MRIKAMIFAAGLGTRLHPITADKPKAMAEVNGKPLLERAIEYLTAFGINDFVVNTHHFASKVQDFIHSYKCKDIRIQISYEEDLLDTAGGLAKAMDLLADADVIVLFNVDIVTNLNLKLLLNEFQESSCDVMLAVQQRKTSRYFLFDDQMLLSGWTNIKTGEVIKDANKDRAILEPYAFNGIHMLSQKVLQNLPQEEQKLSLTPFYLEKRQELSIKGFVMPKEVFWLDCGKPETLAQAYQYYKTLSD
jgi:MurNAc alpha-1-phosphate uridylyltransferase